MGNSYLKPDAMIDAEYAKMNSTSYDIKILPMTEQYYEALSGSDQLRACRDASFAKAKTGADAKYFTEAEQIMRLATEGPLGIATEKGRMVLAERGPSKSLSAVSDNFISQTKPEPKQTSITQDIRAAVHSVDAPAPIVTEPAKSQPVEEVAKSVQTETPVATAKPKSSVQAYKDAIAGNNAPVPTVDVDKDFF